MEEKLTTLKTDEKNLRAELATLRSKPLLSELRQDIGRLEKEKESILARLDEFHGHDSSAQVSPEKRAEVEREWKRWQRQVNMRRRICRDMWMKCSEVVPEGMTREELWVCLFFFFSFRTLSHKAEISIFLKILNRNPWGLRVIANGRDKADAPFLILRSDVQYEVHETVQPRYGFPTPAVICIGMERITPYSVWSMEYKR